MYTRELTDSEVAALFPLQGWRTKCGNRTWLPKKERVHEFAELGADVRNCGTADGYVPVTVYACVKCGTDKMKRT